MKEDVLNGTKNVINEYWRNWSRRLGSPAAETPRTKTRRLLRYVNVSDHVRRTLMFHNAVIDNLRSHYKKCKTQIAKRRIRSLIMSRTVRQCKMQMFCRDVFWLFLKSQSRKSSNWKYKKSALNLPSDSTAFRERLHHTVKQFYLRDDVSHNTSGKKETITKNKRKMQKRLVIDTLQDLHRKFLAEFPNMKISYFIYAGCV